MLIAADQGNLPLVKLLISKGFNVNAKGRTSATPLILAVAGRPHLGMRSVWFVEGQKSDSDDRVQLVRYLLAHGADVSGKTHLGNNLFFTALEIARERQAARIEKLLRQKGAVDERSTGQ